MKKILRIIGCLIGLTLIILNLVPYFSGEISFPVYSDFNLFSSYTGTLIGSNLIMIVGIIICIISLRGINKNKKL